jgi:hypothetical protein
MAQRDSTPIEDGKKPQSQVLDPTAQRPKPLAVQVVDALIDGAAAIAKSSVRKLLPLVRRRRHRLPRWIIRRFRRASAVFWRPLPRQAVACGFGSAAIEAAAC